MCQGAKIHEEYLFSNGMVTKGLGWDWVGIVYIFIKVKIY